MGFRMYYFTISKKKQSYNFLGSKTYKPNIDLKAIEQWVFVFSWLWTAPMLVNRIFNLPQIWTSWSHLNAKKRNPVNRVGGAAGAYFQLFFGAPLAQVIFCY